MANKRFNDETHFIIHKCTERLNSSDLEGDAIDYVEPQVPVTELLPIYKKLQNEYKIISKQDESSVDIDNNCDSDVLSFCSSSFVVGVLWLHLQRSEQPLFPFEAFECMKQMVLFHIPSEPCAETDEDVYVDIVLDAIETKELVQLMAALPVAARKKLYLMFRFFKLLLKYSNDINELDVAEKAAPIIARPDKTAFFSIRHQHDLVFVHLAVASLLQRFDDLKDSFLSIAEPTNYISSKKVFDEVSLSDKSSSSFKKNMDTSSYPSEDSVITSARSTGSFLPRKSIRLSADIHDAAANLEPIYIFDSQNGQSPRGSLDAVAMTSTSSPMRKRTGNATTVSKLLSSTIQSACNGDTDWMKFARQAALAECNDSLFMMKDKRENTQNSKNGEDGSLSTVEQSQDESCSEASLSADKDCSTCIYSNPTSQQTSCSNNHDDNFMGVESGTNDLQYVSYVPHKGFGGSESNQNEEKEQTKAKDEDREPGNALEMNEDVIIYLEKRKTYLKARLRQFDDDFALLHGRKPTNQEKERIRHLYEEYNTVKNCISTCSTAFLYRSSVDNKNQIGLNDTSSITDTSPKDNDGEALKDYSACMTNIESIKKGCYMTEIAVLEQNKRTLLMRLRAFEKQFESKNGREIKCADDIHGYESDYKQYKALKNAIAYLRIGKIRQNDRDMNIVNPGTFCAGGRLSKGETS